MGKHTRKKTHWQLKGNSTNFLQRSSKKRPLLKTFFSNRNMYIIFHTISNTSGILRAKKHPGNPTWNLQIGGFGSMFLLLGPFRSTFRFLPLEKFGGGGSIHSPNSWKFHRFTPFSPPKEKLNSCLVGVCYQHQLFFISELDGTRQLISLPIVQYILKQKTSRTKNLTYQATFNMYKLWNCWSDLFALHLPFFRLRNLTFLLPKRVWSQRLCPPKQLSSDHNPYIGSWRDPYIGYL